MISGGCNDIDMQAETGRGKKERQTGRKRVGDVWTLAEDHVFGPVFLINNVLALLTAASQLFKMASTHTHTHSM